MPLASGLFSAKELYKLARMNSSGAVPDESRESLPLPVRTRDGLRVQFLFFAAVPRPNVQMLGVPQHLATMAPRSGQLETLKRVTPADFGQKHDPSQPIGPYQMPATVTLEDFTRDIDRLFELYDVLIPAFADSKPISAIDPKVREEFARLFKHVYEAVLGPYYRAAAPEFFTWAGVSP